MKWGEGNSQKFRRPIYKLQEKFGLRKLGLNGFLEFSLKRHDYLRGVGVKIIRFVACDF